MNAQPREFRQALPDAIEAEQTLLGLILMNNAAFVEVDGILQPDDFTEPTHREIFSVVAEVIRSGKKATPPSVKQYLPENVDGLRIEGEPATLARYMAHLAANGPLFSAGALNDAMMIRDVSRRRRLIVAGHDISDIGLHAAPEDRFTDLIGKAQEKLFSIDAGDALDSITTAASEIDRMMSGVKRKSRPTVPLPLPQLEEVMGERLEAGNLYGMLSGSGEGKTSMVLQIMLHAAENGHPTLLLSYDQLWDQCILQMASQKLGIEHTRLKQEDRLQTAERERKWSCIHDIRGLPMAYKKCSGRRDGSAQIVSYARRFLTTFAPRYEKAPLIILDHVRKVKPRNDRDHEGRIAAEVNGACKDVASEYGAVWLSLNQRSTAGAKRKNPRPIDLDLYGGEMAREDYDGMFYLYRAWKYRTTQLATAADEKEEREIEGRFAREKWEAHQAEIGALKVRFGNPSRRFRLRFEGEFTRYVSMRDQGEPAFEGFEGF